MAQCSPQEIFLTSNIVKILQLKYCDELIGTNIVKQIQNIVIFMQTNKRLTYLPVTFRAAGFLRFLVRSFEDCKIPPSVSSFNCVISFVVSAGSSGWRL